MDKQHIIDEIKRTAKANNEVALGWRRFQEETGIRYYDWYGQFWTRWSDAVREAGLVPNRMSEAYDDRFLLGQLALFTRRIGRVPTKGDLLLATKADSAFPSEKVFRRLGPKLECASRIIAYCEANPGHDDVAALWRQLPPAKRSPDTEENENASPAFGYVYLLKHGSRRVQGRPYEQPSAT